MYTLNIIDTKLIFFTNFCKIAINKCSFKIELLQEILVYTITF